MLIQRYQILAETDRFDFLDQIPLMRYIQWKNKQLKLTMQFFRLELVFNQFHNILRLFDVSPNVRLTTSETMGHYYL